MKLDNLTPEILQAALTMLGMGLAAVAAVFLVGVLTKYAGPLLKEGKPLDVTMLAQVEGKRTRMDTAQTGDANAPRPMRYYVTFLPDARRAV